MLLRIKGKPWSEHILFRRLVFPIHQSLPLGISGLMVSGRENGLFLPEVSVEEAQKMSGHLQTFPEQALGGPSQESAWA